MGNTEVKSFISTTEANPLFQSLNLEMLGHTEFLSDAWLQSQIEKNKEHQNFFDWSNVQRVTHPEEIQKNIQLQEKKESLLVGKLPPMISPDLLNPTFFDDVQLPFAPSDVVEFKDLQNKKFLILYHFFTKMQKTRKQEQNPLQNLDLNLAAEIPKAAEVGILSGIHLLVALLREVAKSNQQLSDETLNFLLGLFADVKPLSLWGNNQIDVVLDKSLHTVVDYLEELISSEQTSSSSKFKALKVLFSLGLLRGSLPNLLSVVSLLRKFNIDVDLSRELKLLKLEKPNTKLDIDKGIFKSRAKVYFESSNEGEDNSAEKQEKAPYVSIATDGKYLYIHSEVEGLLKIGTGYGYTMLGKVYKHMKDYRLKERATLAFILGKLYYRSSRIGPVPLIELNTDTLEETGAQVHYESLTPNAIFAELTNPEIEFPIPSNAETDLKGGQEPSSPEKINPLAKAKGGTTETSTGIQTRLATAVAQKRELRLMRPAQRSPMFTDGRYIYIVSQWTVDSRSGRVGGGADSDDEDEGGESQEMKLARYGVDIYDPLLDFGHVRSVELLDSQPVVPFSGLQQQVRPKPVLTPKILDRASFTTNGAELLVACPAIGDEGTEMGCRYFSLMDGRLRRNTPNREGFYSVICYDSHNNAVWKIGNIANNFVVTCLESESAAEPVSFPENSDFYVAFENRQIIELASGGVGLQQFGNDTIYKEKDQKKRQALRTLMRLGFHDDPEEDEKAEDLSPGTHQNLVSKSKATQLFILANIARLAEGYASLKSLNDAQNIRKPYCVHLIKKVFRYLEELIDQYSRNFFDVLESQMTDDVLYDQCSFLCTLRVLKYNLFALESHSESLKSVGLKIINDKFPAKLHKFVWKILEMKPLETNEYEDVRKAAYNEALSILQYALSVIFPDISSILSLLKTHLKDLKSQLNRDISGSVLFWLKSKDHIAKLIEQIVRNSEQASQFVAEIRGLINEIICWEIQKFSNYLKACSEWNKLPVYESEELITTSMSFAIEFQKEVLFQLGQKVQEKSLDHTPIHQTNADLTEILCKNGILVNFEFQNTLSKLGQKIVQHFDQAERSGKLEEDGSDKKVPTALLKYQVKAKKKKTKEMLISETYQNVWEKISHVYNQKIYFSKLLSYQIETLALLASNFIIAAKSLKNLTVLLTSLNSLSETKKKFQKEQKSTEAPKDLEQNIIYESTHPITETTKKEKITISGAAQLRITFDPRCDLRMNSDFLQLFVDEHLLTSITPRMEGQETWPRHEIVVQGDTCWYFFNKPSFGNNGNWGYKFTVSASVKDKLDEDWFTSLHRTTCWLAGKCAGQLINGSALQQAMLQDEEQKYNSLLTSKLFSGGIEKCYFSRGKEGVWVQLGDIINEFEAGHLGEYLSGEMTEAEREEEEFLSTVMCPKKDVQMDKTIDFIQKLFIKEALWGNLGGENGSKCVRAAYAVIIKHAGLINDLKEAMIEVELFNDEKDKVSPNLKNLVKKWASASRMRPWLVEKRKDIDDREEKILQFTQAAQKQSPSKPSGQSRKGAKKGEESKEETIPMEEEKEIDPISQGGMQMRDSEEIIQRMIDQILRKAEFLCQLIPSKHWSQDRTEKKEKQLLFRTASKNDDEVNKDEEWKRRLHQWKSVRQAKQVYKSLEDEIQEIHTSLNTSVLLCLQSGVSIKRLRKQVESAYLRAICRTIGLNALTSIMTGVKSSLYRQDIVGWLCTSLRGSENKIYHFTDNLQGCGHYLESTVNTAFKNVILAIIKSMSNSAESEEVNCMLESLKWKYHGDDHVFLAEIDLFGVLRGQDPKQILRKAWGQSLDHRVPGRVDPRLVKNLIKLFEIVVILCVGKLNWTNSEQKATVASKKDKIPSLERHVSAIDEYSVEILIKQAFQVLFAELEDAENNYAQFEGMNWRIYNRVKAIKAYQLTKSKSKKPKEEGRKIATASRAGAQRGTGGGLLSAAFQSSFQSPQERYEEDYEDESMHLQSRIAEISFGHSNAANNSGMFSGFGGSNPYSQQTSLGGGGGLPGVGLQSMFPRQPGGGGGGLLGARSQMQQQQQPFLATRPARRVQTGLQKADTFSDEELDPTEEKFLKEIQEEEKTRIEPEEESKSTAKTNKDDDEEEEKYEINENKAIEEDEDEEQRALRRQRRKLYRTLVDREMKLVKEMQQRLYNPQFLYRLIALIYKCVTMGSDNVSVVVGNPKYIAILFALLKYAPPSHQILITKTIEAIFQILPHELFIDSIRDLQKKLTRREEYITVQDKEDDSLKVIKHFLNVLVEVRRKIFEPEFESRGAFAVSCEILGLIRRLLTNPSWGRYVEYWLTEAIKSQDALLKQTAFGILGGDLNGLRIGGKMLISTNNRDEVFADNVLLKQDYSSSTETATIVGFAIEYVEKASEFDGRRNLDPKNARRDKQKIELDIGTTQSDLNPVALIHSTISKEVQSFSTIELATVNRYNSFAIDSVPFFTETYDLSKNLSVLIPTYTWAVSEQTPKDTNSLYLRTLAMKSLNNYMKSQENVFLISSKHKDLIDSILNLATTKVASIQLMNLEITEEKLFRLLQTSSEKELAFRDLPALFVTVKNKEIEILLGKDLSTMRFSIQAGFNLSNVKKYHEVIRAEDVVELAKKKSLRVFLADKAVLIRAKDMQKYSEYITVAAVVITFNFQMQSFADHYDKATTQASKKSEGLRQNGEDMIILSKTGDENPKKEK